MIIKIEKGSIEDTLNKLVETEEGIKCSCGGLLTMTCHIDGKDFYTTNYQCECGNNISARFKRDDDEMMYWD